jgi:murein DD-endopeptidase MepM/ murein hydrolase activator NlpD
MQRRLLTVAALVALAPTFQAAGQVAERVSERAVARPHAVFPVRGRVDWGEADGRFGAARSGHVHEGQDMFARAGTPLVAIRDGRVVEVGDDGGRGNYVAIWGNHLHFEIRSGGGTTGRAHDPLGLLKRLAARRAARR